MNAAQAASLLELGILVGVVVIVAAMRRGRVRRQWLPVVVLVMVVHEATLTQGFWTIPTPSIFEGLAWNWFNKMLAAVATLVLILLIPRLDFRRAGVTWRHDPGSIFPTVLVSVAICALLTAAALQFGGEDPGNLEAIAFQLTLPGIEEEIYYRGLLLVVLNEMLGRPSRVPGVTLGFGAFVTAFAFGLGHLIGWNEQGLTFAWTSGVFTALAGLVLVWIRERSGSVVQPLLIHNYGNTIFYLV